MPTIPQEQMAVLARALIGKIAANRARGSLARAILPVQQLPPGATPVYRAMVVVIHSWTRAGKAKRLVRFQCSCCGAVRWEKQASRLAASDKGRVAPGDEVLMVPCDEILAAQIHDS